MLLLQTGVLIAALAAAPAPASAPVDGPRLSLIHI